MGTEFETLVQSNGRSESDNSKKKSSSAFRTIGEVAAELSLPPHVLRFWESKFTQIKPHKRRGGHRYYRPEDIEVLRDVKTLLYDMGYTIKGAQKHLKDVKKGLVNKEEDQSNLFEKSEQSASNQNDDLSDANKEILTKVLDELVELRKMLD